MSQDIWVTDEGPNCIQNDSTEGNIQCVICKSGHRLTTLWQDIHWYIHRYIPHPPIYPPISSDTSSDTATTHPLTYDMRSFHKSHLTDLQCYDKTSTGTSTGTSHILQYILRYPPTHLLTHPLTQPPHILWHMMCIHSVSPTSQTYDVMTRHPPVHPLVQSTTSKTPSETSSDASSDTATTHPPTYDVHSFPHPPAHLLACRHNLQHWHSTTSGIAPCNTMHLSPLLHAGITPLMWYLPFMRLCLMRPSWITHYAWCGLFLTWSICSYIYDLPFIPYLHFHFRAMKV